MVAALATAASITVAAAAGWILFRDPPKPSAPSKPTRQFEITVPRLSVLEGQSLSPDGSHLAFIGPAADGVPVLWLRSTTINGTVRVLPETRQAELSRLLFWSRDGRFPPPPPPSRDASTSTAYLRSPSPTSKAR